MHGAQHLVLSDASHVGEARRRSVAQAQALGFEESEAGKVAIVVTELVNNALRHAKGGEVFIRPLLTSQGIEILVLDTGPGMSNVEACLRDGYSTGGTPGTGLGAVVRLSSDCEIFSTPQVGTAVMARFLKPSRTPPAHALVEEGAVNVPYPGEILCGDGWSLADTDTGATIMVADGLGHGLKAYEAAMEACKAFASNRPDGNLATSFQRLHQALRSTRGAAVGMAALDLAARTVRYMGVGNISAAVALPDGTMRHMANHAGIVGYEMRKLQEFSYPWSPEATLVLWSDGIVTHWDLRRYPGIWSAHPSILAGIILRDFRRGNDDATVVVVREARQRERSVRT